MNEPPVLTLPMLVVIGSIGGLLVSTSDRSKGSRVHDRLRTGHVIGLLVDHLKVYVGGRKTRTTTARIGSATSIAKNAKRLHTEP